MSFNQFVDVGQKNSKISSLFNFKPISRLRGKIIYHTKPSLNHVRRKGYKQLLCDASQSRIELTNFILKPKCLVAQFELWLQFFICNKLDQLFFQGRAEITFRRTLVSNRLQNSHSVSFAHWRAKIAHYWANSPSLGIPGLDSQFYPIENVLLNN